MNRVAALVPLVALAAAGPAHGHLVATPQGGLAQVEKAQQRNHAHAVYVARHGTGKVRQWHQLAVRWTGRELRETRRALIAHRFRTTVAVSGMWYEIAVCESGSRPPAWHINTGNGFYGGLQFLTSTWLAYGGGRYAPRADLAAPWQQVAVASRMSLSHWPTCSGPFRWS